MSDASLTDYEIAALAQEVNLADGHAYQGLSVPLAGMVSLLPQIWTECEQTPIPEMEARFANAFGLLAHSRSFGSGAVYKICPTASNSLDIVGAVLAQRGLAATLVEPTFDNIALLLKRRGVNLASLNDAALIAAANSNRLPSLLSEHPGDALVLVQPNNPTGSVLNAASFAAIADYCAWRGTLLVVDNSFRFFKRQPFDDIAILRESGVSFMTVEDTGKVWATQDLKASLLLCSDDLASTVTTIYNELFLCTSRFTLAVLEECLLRTCAAGLSGTIWSQVDRRRASVRRAVATTSLQVDASALGSTISVEWLDCRGTGMDDLVLTSELAREGLHVLPGRQFYWASGREHSRQLNIRLALMKPLPIVESACEILCATCPSPSALAVG